MILSQIFLNIIFLFAFLVYKYLTSSFQSLRYNLIPILIKMLTNTKKTALIFLNYSRSQFISSRRCIIILFQPTPPLDKYSYYTHVGHVNLSDFISLYLFIIIFISLLLLNILHHLEITKDYHSTYSHCIKTIHKAKRNKIPNLMSYSGF